MISKIKEILDIEFRFKIGSILMILARVLFYVLFFIFLESIWGFNFYPLNFLIIIGALFSIIYIGYKIKKQGFFNIIKEEFSYNPWKTND